MSSPPSLGGYIVTIFTGAKYDRATRLHQNIIGHEDMQVASVGLEG